MRNMSQLVDALSSSLDTILSLSVFKKISSCLDDLDKVGVDTYSMKCLIDDVFSKIIHLDTKIKIHSPIREEVRSPPSFRIGEPCMPVLALISNMSAHRCTESTNSTSWATPNHPTMINGLCSLSPELLSGKVPPSTRVALAPAIVGI
jgi:hypothetical protein